MNGTAVSVSMLCSSERFLGFTDCPNLDASFLAEQTVSQLHSLGLSLTRCVAQCCDGASLMSGHLSGVQSIQV